MPVYASTFCERLRSFSENQPVNERDITGIFRRKSCFKEIFGKIVVI